MDRYTIKSGDTLWAIAERQLGDGSRWRELARLNEDTILEAQKKNPRFRDGTFQYGPHWIFPGTVLEIPVQ